MQRRALLSTIAAASASLAVAPASFAQSTPDPATPTAMSGSPAGPQTGYAPVNGLDMYYEVHGAGEPLVLLHGAFATIDLWGPILETLAANYQVIAVEFQGHGHTADIDRPFSYEAFADDVDALMEHLDIPQADIVGYSMGGNTGLQLAIRHPDRVRKLVALSANYRRDGYHPDVLATIEFLTPELFAGSPIEASYLRHAPNPEDWPALVDRIKTLDGTDFAWPEEDLRSITSPTLLIVGDSDSVRPDHAVEMFLLLGGGVSGDLGPLPRAQLAILPGTTHITIILERLDELMATVTRFLAAPLPDPA